MAAAAATLGDGDSGGRGRNGRRRWRLWSREIATTAAAADPLPRTTAGNTIPEDRHLPEYLHLPEYRHLPETPPPKR
ncbi:hypothetical protein KSP39_PZI009186 [Platanthera zijinensis]|uniref:Uncharacterized protein n=1 Tax=Platanthera zijinensis TaxID=2320716 RepID=A0AAP0G7W2_9ASPA